MSAADASPPKVSVCVITYNHAAYIADCLRSLVDQGADFAFEILVGDDCSDDGASPIIDAFASRHPRMVQVIRPERNRGGTQNYLATHGAASGEYVANVDGDDLALPGKLARQAAFLDQHREAVACGHRVGIVTEDGVRTGGRFPAKLAQTIDIRKVIRCGMPFMNSSLMYRRSAYAPRTSAEEIFDWYFLTDLMKSGRAGYLDDELGLYRVNSGSITAALKQSRMRSKILELYALRAGELPQYRSEYFAAAFFDLLACIRDGDEVSRAHRQLLRNGLGVEGLLKAFDTLAWRWQNRRALAR